MRFAPAVLRVCAVLLLCGCGGQKLAEPELVPGHQPVDLSRAELLRRIAGWSDSAVDATTAADLRESLRDLVTTSPQSRWTSAPPDGQHSAVNDLLLSAGQAGDRHLTWTYRNHGDYDLNGEANIGDLSALGQHFLKGTSSPDWAAARLSDGDGNGEVNLADITPLGANLFSQVVGYRVLGATTVDGTFEVLGEISLAEAAATEPPTFSFNLPSGAWVVFCVEPVDALAVGGIKSNFSYEGAELAALPGAPGNLANLVLPQIGFPPVQPTDVIFAPSGLPLAGDRIAVTFKALATVGAVNGLLTTLGATISGSDPVTNVVILGFDLLPDAAALEQKLTTARADNTVEIACADVPAIGGPHPGEVHDIGFDEEQQGQGLRALPPHHTPFDDIDVYGTGYPATTHGTCGSNWGLQNVRAPQGWNLRDYALRNGALAGAIVIDVFPDLTYRHGIPYSELTSRYEMYEMVPDIGTHGTSVMTTLAADWDNQERFESINPLDPPLYGTSVIDSLQTEASWMGILEKIFPKGLAQYPNAVVVNMSFGLPVGFAHTSNASWLDPLGDIFQKSAETFATDKRSNFLLCSAAGYEGDTTGGLLPNDSVPDNVAVRYPGGHFICVEAITEADEYIRSRMVINLGGTVSAPGYECPFSGTSFATPMVSSLITYLWSLDPSLTWQQVKDLATGASYTVPTIGGTKPRIDVFSAIMGIDQLTGSDRLLRALVDVDDGTRDGQLRMDPFAGSLHTSIETPDGRLGDGQATMRDLRAWRDAFLQSQTTGPLADSKLDGPALHFKRDSNMNCVIGPDPVDPPHNFPALAIRDSSSSKFIGDHIYARHDFNGDGTVSMDPAPVNGTPRSDLEMLVDPALWAADEIDGYSEGVAADPALEGSEAGASRWKPVRYALGNRDADTSAPAELKGLPDYLHSFDLHLDVDFTKVPTNVESVELIVAAELWPDGLDNNDQDGADEPFEVLFERRATVTRATPLPLVVTLPLWTGNARVSWEGMGGPTFSGAKDLAGLKFGADRAVTIPSAEWVISDVGPGSANQLLTVVDNCPALMQLATGSNYVLRYRIAADPDATSWSAPQDLASALIGLHYDFANVNGVPAVAFAINAESGDTLSYRRGSDARGTTWTAAAEISTTGEDIDLAFPRLAEVDGSPAVAFNRDDKAAAEWHETLEYVRASVPDGSSWGSPAIVLDGISNDAYDLVAVGGKPVLATSDYRVLDGPTFFALGFGSSANGGFSLMPHPEPENIIELAENAGNLLVLGREHSGSGLIYNYVGGVEAGRTEVPAGVRHLSVIGGKPAVVLAEGPAIMYMRANDAAGTVWGAPVEVTQEPFAFITDLCDVGGRPAIVYRSGTADRFAILK